MLTTIDNLTRKVLRITIPTAIFMIGLCTGVASMPPQHCAAPARRENSVLILASALQETNALKPYHGRR